MAQHDMLRNGRRNHQYGWLVAWLVNGDEAVRFWLLMAMN